MSTLSISASQDRTGTSSQRRSSAQKRARKASAARQPALHDTQQQHAGSHLPPQQHRQQHRVHGLNSCGAKRGPGAPRPPPPPRAPLQRGRRAKAARRPARAPAAAPPAEPRARPQQLWGKTWTPCTASGAATAGSAATRTPCKTRPPSRTCPRSSTSSSTACTASIAVGQDVDPVNRVRRRHRELRCSADDEQKQHAVLHVPPQQHRQQHRVHGVNSRGKTPTMCTASAAATASPRRRAQSTPGPRPRRWLRPVAQDAGLRALRVPWRPTTREANSANHVRVAVGARPRRRRRPRRDAKADPSRASRAPPPTSPDIKFKATTSASATAPVSWRDAGCATRSPRASSTAPRSLTTALPTAPAWCRRECAATRCACATSSTSDATTAPGTSRQTNAT